MDKPHMQRTEFYADGSTTTTNYPQSDADTATESPVFVLVQSEPICRLRLVDGFEICFAKPMPCRWWRFWQWLLLGWRWDKEVT